MPYTQPVALSPGIPTSFVPKQPVQTPRRKVSAGSNLFMLVSFAVTGLVVLVSGAVFAYSQFLAHVEITKAAELQKQQDAVDTDTVREYIRLKDRFNSGASLLDNHITLSRFFDDLESLTLQNVQFTKLSLTVAGDGTAKLDLDGIAKNFNALAVQSNNVAGDKLIKRAIFSDIGFDSSSKTSSRIKFKLTADLDPKLLHGGSQAGIVAQPAAVPVAPVSTTTTP